MYFKLWGVILMIPERAGIKLFNRVLTNKSC